ncbi:MAG: AMP-binding protein [Clostridia bacterium]|nr:AMP-binding protein [Clostridia bacterium]
MAKYENYSTVVYENLKKMYHVSADKYGDKAVFMQKENGTYRSISYRQYCSDVDALGTALLARGFGGKRIIVSGENCYAWVTAYMAVICGVGVVVPTDKELPAEEIANIANISEASAVIYSSKIADKIASIDEKVTRITFESLPALIKEGRNLIKKGNRAFLDAKIDSHAMSALIFTSGTTGVSKGVMLSHRNICFNLSEMCQMFYIGENDVFLSVLPLHHVYECTCGFLCLVYRGCTVAFSEGLRYITRNMQEVHPTMMLCVPLLLETLYNKVWASIRKQGLEKKVKAAIIATNAIPGAKARMAAKKRIFSDIHKNFGGQLRALISGGAAVDPMVLKGLRDLGLCGYQGYGLTECAPLAALNRDTFYNDKSAGMATPNGVLDIYDMQDDGTGEIRYKGDNIMIGYYKAPELTAEVIRDGWFYTGDLGYMDSNGFLYITGRKKNVIVTSNGKNIFPEELETYLNRTNFVAESVVVGYINPKKKDYDIVAILVPDRERLEEVYGKRYTQKQVDLEMKKAISEVNCIVQSYKRIETYVLREEEFPKNTSRKIKRAGLADAAYDAYRKKIGE